MSWELACGEGKGREVRILPYTFRTPSSSSSSRNLAREWQTRCLHPQLAPHPLLLRLLRHHPLPLLPRQQQPQRQRRTSLFG